MGNPGSEAGSAVYSKNVLSIYDPFVLGFSSRFAWGSPARRTVNFYDEQVRGRHLDVGVGTGYFLDKCQFPVEEPEIGLLDMNENSLGTTADRLKRYRPQIYSADILQPITIKAKPFDSIGMSFLLHCLPGSLPEKAAAVFTNLKPYLAPGGVLFGTTILGKGMKPNPLARVFMRIYNRKGIFSNAGDGLAGLEAALKSTFTSYSLDNHGLVAFFTGKLR